MATIQSDPCRGKAKADEPIFTLLGRDKHAPVLVVLWAAMREMDGERPGKVAEARATADEMTAYQRAAGKRPCGMGTAGMAATAELVRTLTEYVDPDCSKTEPTTFPQSLAWAKKAEAVASPTCQQPDVLGDCIRDANKADAWSRLEFAVVMVASLLVRPKPGAVEWVNEFDKYQRQADAAAREIGLPFAGMGATRDKVERDELLALVRRQMETVNTSGGLTPWANDARDLLDRIDHPFDPDAVARL